MKIDTSGIPDFLEKPQNSHLGSGRNVPVNSADLSLQVDYASLIDKAVQADDTDINTVQRAREMLLSGKLDSAENIRRAAENIIKFGI